MKPLILTTLFILTLSINAFAEVTYAVISNNPKAPNEEIIKSMDRTCEIVPKLLGMESVNLDIKIYFTKDRMELREKCPIKIGKTPAAYYIPTLNTIFMYRYTRPVFAHELTHALLNAYFGKSFPYEIQEIIPQYIENTMRKIY